MSTKPSFQLILDKNITLLQRLLISHPLGCYNHWDFNFNSLRWLVFMVSDSYSGALGTQYPPWCLLALDHPAATASLPASVCFRSQRRLGAGQPWGVASAILTSPRSLWPPDLWVEPWLAPTPPHPLTSSNKLGSVQQLRVCADVGPCLQCWLAWPGGGFTVTAEAKAETDLTSNICSISYSFDVSIQAGLVGQRSLVCLSGGPNHPWLISLPQ